MNDPKDRKDTHRKKVWNLLLAIAAFCAAASLLGDLAAWMVYWLGGVSFAVSKAETIGIIGGADGPTAIFVTASTAPLWQTILKLLLLITGILGWSHMNRKNKN